WLMMAPSSKLLRRTAILCLIAVVSGWLINSGPVHARRRRRKPTPTVTPTASPTPQLKPLVMMTGGIGTVGVPTGESPAVLETAEIYDPGTGQFLPIKSMESRRDHQAAAILQNGSVLIMGGVDAVLVPMIMFSGPAMPWILKSAEIFDPIAGFKKTGDMDQARDEPTATLLKDGRVLVIGGSTVVAELYDPKTGKFATAGKMNSARYGQTATLLADGHVLILGGGTRKGELYNPPSGKFAATGEMSINRIYHTATLLNDGRVLVAGGSPYAKSLPLSTTEIYTPRSGTFRAGPKMKKERAGQSATKLEDGRVLIAGGHNDNSAEIFDPGTGAFVDTSPMKAGRFDHSATLLPDGKVLVAGGFDQTFKPLDSAELFDPSSNSFIPTGVM